MAVKGLLVEYRWCTGCYSCELACQSEHGLDGERSGIKVCEVGPWQIQEDHWQYRYFPVLTDECNLCASRTALGKQPSCVQHCQASCLRIVDAAEAAATLGENPHKQIFQTL